MGLPINDPSVGAALQELFGLQGRVRPVLEESIIPTVQVADLSEGSRPARIRHASAHFDVGANAVEHFVARLEAPPSVLMELTSFRLAPLSAGEVQVFFGSSIPVPSTFASKAYTDQRVRDTKSGGTQSPGGLLTIGTQVASLGTVQWGIFLNADNLLYEYSPKGWFVGSLAPAGFGFIEFSFGSNNVRVRGSMEWTEYQIF